MHVLYDHCGVQVHVLWSEADADILLNHSTLFFETKSLTESGSELAANTPTNLPAAISCVTEVTAVYGATPKILHGSCGSELSAHACTANGLGH